MSSIAEQKVKKLARLPGNSVCANCGTSKKFGFSTVCIKFHTFVCNNCKSSHQAISHRCKSLTMSSWTDAEVAELEAKGNDYARRTWLKNAPPVGTGGRPKEGDHVDVFKRFVVDVYERKRYYGEDAGAPPAPPPQQQHVATAIPLQAPTAAAQRMAQRAFPPVAAPAPVPRAPAPAPAVDLFDFATPAPTPAPSSFQADFDAFGSSPAPAPTTSGGSAFGFISAPPASSPAPAPATSSSFQADFGGFQTSAPAPSDGSAFGFILPPPAAAPTPAPAPASSGFAFISKPPAAASAPAPVSNDFADFAGMTISSPSPATTIAQQPAVKKPVMSHSSNQKSSLISSMDTMSAPSQPAMGFGGMMPQQQGGLMNGMGMGMNNLSQQQMMMQQRMMMQQQQGMGMGGMNMHNNMGMMNPGMMGGGFNNTNSGAGIGMMTPQQMMNFGGGSQPNNNRNVMNNPSAMSSLSMSGMDMNAWTTGKK